MNRRGFLIGFVLVMLAGFGTAGADGPIQVEAFSFDSLETRRAEFQLPDAEQGPWRRILMHYTLKCDERTPGDQYPCGEWDVNTYTRVWLHTGRLDSTLHRQPRFIVKGESPDSLLYSIEPRQQSGFKRFRSPNPFSVKGIRHFDSSFLRFQGTDYLEVPAAAFADVDSSLTISFRVRGAAEQPRNDHILEAGDRGGRLVNIHLPWGTGEVYWDAGGRLSGNTNRISKGAEAEQYKGRWNDWTFVKDASRGRMAIFLNGNLWHEAFNMKKSMAGIDQFIIGANLNANGGWFAGDLDDIYIYDIALSDAEVQKWWMVSPSIHRPHWDNLILAYEFEDDPPDLILDSGPRGNHALPMGLPQHRPHWFATSGDSLMMGSAPKSALIPAASECSIPADRMSVILFEDEDQPLVPTDTLTLWPAYDENYDEEGHRVDRVPIDDPAVLVQSWHEWYGEPFEVIEPIEIGRFITPYGKRLDLGEDGFTWTVDVTDYAPLLRGKVDLEAHNGYELLDLRFEYIPGEPAREVLAIENLWPGGNFKYGALADDEELRPLHFTLSEDAAGFAVRSRISGHGHSGPRNCCEWDAKEHSLLLNGLPRFAWTLWRDCGFNPVHPQGGTWQFDRAGWCPGTFVHTQLSELSPIVSPGEEIALDYQVEAYDPEIAEEDGRFYIEQQLFSYGPIRAKRDAAIDRILAPSDHDELSRINPISTEPIVVIRNLGSEALRSVEIRYGLEEGATSRYAWRGNLPFGAADTLTLPKPDWSGLEAGATFGVELKVPNGQRDQYGDDNRATSDCPAPVLLPEDFVVSADLPGFDRWLDNSWTITDARGDTLAARDSYPAAGLVNDPVTLAPGAYVFTFNDSEEDGLIRHWWLRGSDPERMGENGGLRILDATGEELLDLGYDFAEKRVLRFFVGEPR